MSGKYLGPILLTLLAGISYAAHAETVRGMGRVTKTAAETNDRRPTGKGWGEPDLSISSPAAVNAATAASTATTTNNGISYHGGPLILGTAHIYYIWYGNWSTLAPAILLDFASSLSGSRYYNINTTYYNRYQLHVSKWVTYHGSTVDKYSRGASLTDSGVQSVVSDAITSGRLPKDSNGVYFVLTSKDVKQTEFCTRYCGWHSYATIAGTDIKFAFVGDATQQCPSACQEQTSNSPNGHTGADGMASIIAHELSEAVTDPDLNAWYDANGAENADKCAWNFGTVKTASNGSRYNVTLGSRDYLIQRNWVNAGGGYCAIGY